uniref:Uncharacterized protein n=2 Tax=Ditylum brightwellii TaxID=49249 RepID=A0A7S4S906_9STRA
MADADVSLGKAGVHAVIEKFKDQILTQVEDHYNEIAVKDQILSELQQIRDDTKVLRGVDFETARDKLTLWSKTRDDMGSFIDIAPLDTASECAARAFHVVSDPLDRLMAVKFLVFADYHRVALSWETDDGNPDWDKGKKAAQAIMHLYFSERKFPQLYKAAKEELKGKNRATRVLRDKKKRREMLLNFNLLDRSVFAMHPVNESSNHPEFPELEKAVVRACYSKGGKIMMLPANIGHTLGPTERITLGGHSDTVNCCALYSGDKLAISGSRDKTLRVWNLFTGEQVQILKGHRGGVECCAVYGDGTHAISGGYDKTLRVWDLATGEEVRTLEGHSEAVMCCALYEDGTHAISGGMDNTIRVWNLSTGDEVWTLEGHSDFVQCCAVYSNSTRAISGSWDQTLRIWNLSTGEELRTLEGHGGGVLCCALCYDGIHAISGSYDKTLRLWDLSTGEERHTLKGHSSAVWSCTACGNDTHAISGSEDKTMKLWNLSTGEKKQTFEGHSDIVRSCTVYGNGTRAISGSDDKTLKIWDLPTLARI